MEASVDCPYCGEPLELWVDPTGGSSQHYIEDCAVCCKPMNVFVTVEEDDDCSVSVSTLDE